MLKILYESFTYCITTKTVAVKKPKLERDNSAWSGVLEPVHRALAGPFPLGGRNQPLDNRAQGKKALRADCIPDLFYFSIRCYVNAVVSPLRLCFYVESGQKFGLNSIAAAVHLSRSRSRMEFFRYS